MKCIGYFIGNEAENEDRIKAYADKHGITLMLVASDAEGRSASFRMIQNRIKYGECDAVLLPSRDHLGTDKYMRLENELFMKRNGVRVILVSKKGIDHRHDIVLSAKRYFGHITDWDTEYGVGMPLMNTRESFTRIPPIGYKVCGGRVVTAENEAETVREVFRRYTAGEALVDIARFADNALASRKGKVGNMTIKTILRNERYLGRLSKKGYHLPPIVTFDMWCAAHERLESVYGSDPLPAPYFAGIYSTRPVTYVCGSGALASLPAPGRGFVIDTSAFNKALEAAVSSTAFESNAEKLYELHILPEYAMADEAYPNAVAENNRVLRDQKQLIKALIDGDRSAALQDELDRITDLKNVTAMRLRRIDSERRLYSITEEEVKRFFARATRMSALSLEERAFIADAFVWAVRITEDGAFAYLRDPAGGGLIKRRLKNVFVK